MKTKDLQPPTQTPAENLNLLAIVNPEKFRAFAGLIDAILREHWAELTKQEKLDAVATYDLRHQEKGGK